MIEDDDNFDERLSKSSFAVRDERPNTDRFVTEDRVLTDDERIEAFRMQMFNNALPDLPNIPGFHTCWLTTTHPRDTIHSRMRLGYVPLTPQEVPGLGIETVTTGEYAGMVAVNEMIAFKLPQHLYQAYMREAHHNEPRRQEEKIAEVADMIRDSARAEGKGIVIEEFEGNEELRKPVAAPAHWS